MDDFKERPLARITLVATTQVMVVFLVGDALITHRMQVQLDGPAGGGSSAGPEPLPQFTGDPVTVLAELVTLVFALERHAGPLFGQPDFQR